MAIRRGPPNDTGSGPSSVSTGDTPCAMARRSFGSSPGIYRGNLPGTCAACVPGRVHEIRVCKLGWLGSDLLYPAHVLVLEPDLYPVGVGL